MVKKLWDKGYDLNKTIESFTVGNDPILDKQLVKYDCIASIAHAKMLGKINLLSKDEVNELVHELNNIIDLDKTGEFNITQEQEDCHTAIEMFLTSKLGDIGKKIHTARSRNDQVLTALRLYYIDHIAIVEQSINRLTTSISNMSNKYGKIQFPGYTHMQKAMPSSFELWCNSFSDSMMDNLILLKTATKLVDQSPLGTAAGYGVPLNIDRKFTAEELQFSRVQENPIYTQYSRGKFEITILHILSQIMLDLNKIASDLILFSMPEFGYVKLPDEFCTGSSIMPQKKNPDVLELLRAKYHIVSSYEFQVSRLTSNLISGYNRDMQLTKEPIMNGFSVTLESLQIADLLFSNLKVNKQKCHDALTDELFATEKVYDLVKQGVPFRDAYLKVARIINKI
ncbi:MAG: argininosuccinate lyase [Candidatus Marinimicrobia bacterium]|nr:argininosuccinate lyase [Candidatus Neomarinimicrobiota bacterium]